MFIERLVFSNSVVAKIAVAAGEPEGNQSVRLCNVDNPLNYVKTTTKILSRKHRNSNG